MLFNACGSGSDYDYDEWEDDYESTASVYIDNGADTTVIVVLEALDKDTTYEFEIESWGLEYVDLSFGKYHVKATTVTDSVIVDEDFVLEEGEDYNYSFNLNLTKEDYIMENMEYAVGATGDERVYSSFTYKGKTYDEVDADVIEGALVVPKDWDYNLDEEFPETVSIYGGANSTTKSKLYRASTFILYLELYEIFSEYDEEGGDEWIDELLEEDTDGDW